MKVKMTMAFLALFLFAGTAGLAAAQDETKTTHKKTRTLRGCLQKGDDAKEYRLTTAKGSTWGIKADSLTRGEHVGHTVSVTGVGAHAKVDGMKEDAKDEAKEHGVAKGPTEHG